MWYRQMYIASCFIAWERVKTPFYDFRNKIIFFKDFIEEFAIKMFPKPSRSNATSFRATSEASRSLAGSFRATSEVSRSLAGSLRVTSEASRSFAGSLRATSIACCSLAGNFRVTSLATYSTAGRFWGVLVSSLQRCNKILGDFIRKNKTLANFKLGFYQHNA